MRKPTKGSEPLSVAGVEVAATIHELAPMAHGVAYVWARFGAVVPGLRKQGTKGGSGVQPAAASYDRDFRSACLGVFK